MIGYFEQNIKHMLAMNVNNASKNKIKYTIFCDGYYHKFVAGYDIHSFLKKGDVDRLVQAVNEQCDNLIVQYQTWPEFGGVYLKCKPVKFVYHINSPELIAKFNSLEDYLDYALGKIIDFSRAVYPCHFNDWLRHNVAVQEDLSWVVVDLDDLLEYRAHIVKQEVIDLLIYKLAREGGITDVDRAREHIAQYFINNPHELDFIEN